MKLVHFGSAGSERPGVIHEGVLWDASTHTNAWTGEDFTEKRLAELMSSIGTFPEVPNAESLRYGAAVSKPGQIICVGLNYREHAEESDMEVPDAPIAFSKSVHSISGPNDDIRMPAHAEKLDWEIELAVVIGTDIYGPTQQEAADAIAGYCIANDVSERAWQLETSGQWFKGKSAPTFCPLGPWVQIRDETFNSEDLSLKLWVNEELRQNSRTSLMIFSPETIVYQLAQYIPFRPGDVVLTGTPSGVGLATQTYLKPGDVVRAQIDGLGEQRQRVHRV